MNGYEILISHGVTRLCHLTLFKSLTHIIHSGIKATHLIGQDIKSVNDFERRDGLLNYICTSVQYPNSWYLKEAAGRNKDKIFYDWVIIYINPSILNEREAKFCPCNAGKDRGAYIDSNMDNIDSIFASSVLGWNYSRSPNMLPCCPTNGQAEILIKDNIPSDFINGIAVENNNIAERVYSTLKFYGKNIPIYISPDVLSTAWSNMVRQGEIPVETQYNCLMEG